MNTKKEAVTKYVTELSRAHVIINSEDSNRSTYNSFKSVHVYKEHLTMLELNADNEVLQHIHDRAFVEYVNEFVSLFSAGYHPNLIITDQHLASLLPLELSVYNRSFITSFENIKLAFIDRFIKSNNLVLPLDVDVHFSKRDVIELAFALLHHPKFMLKNSSCESESIAYICSRLCYVFDMPPIINVKEPVSQIKRRKKTKSPFLHSLIDAFNRSL